MDDKLYAQVELCITVPTARTIRCAHCAKTVSSRPSTSRTSTALCNEQRANKRKNSRPDPCHCVKRCHTQDLLRPRMDDSAKNNRKAKHVTTDRKKATSASSQSSENAHNVFTPQSNPCAQLDPAQVRNCTLQLLHRINATRQTNARAPVRLSRTLTRVAKAHNQDQASAGRISHTGSDGSSLRERVERQGYVMQSAAENVAAGQKNAAHVHASFMKSAGHARNVLKAAVDDVGLDVTVGRDGRLYWTEVFGRRRG